MPARGERNARRCRLPERGEDTFDRLRREARQVEHDHKVDAALVQSAERQQVLTLAAIGGLDALGFLVKPFEDFIVLAAAVTDCASARKRLDADLSGVVELEPFIYRPRRMRMEQRGATEVEVRAMLERATGSRPASWRAES